MPVLGESSSVPQPRPAATRELRIFFSLSWNTLPCSGEVAGAGSAENIALACLSTALGSVQLLWLASRKRPRNLLSRYSL